DACVHAGAVWGGGESPTLADLVAEADIEIAGSAFGVIPDQKPILGDDLAAGDDIVLIESSGLHTNGASLVRALAEQLPGGYRTLLPNGKEFGEAVLAPSRIYVPLVAALKADPTVHVTYLSHTTGHGLRKLMRADRDLTYRIRTFELPIPEVLEEIRRFA